MISNLWGIQSANLPHDEVDKSFAFAAIMKSQSIWRLIGHKEWWRLYLWIAESKVLMKVIKIAEKIPQRPSKNLEYPVSKRNTGIYFQYHNIVTPASTKSMSWLLWGLVSLSILWKKWRENVPKLQACIGPWFILSSRGELFVASIDDLSWENIQSVPNWPLLNITHTCNQRIDQLIKYGEETQ